MNVIYESIFKASKYALIYIYTKLLRSVIIDTFLRYACTKLLLILNTIY